MIKERKISKSIVSIILMLIVSLSIGFVAMQIAKPNDEINLSASTVSDVSTTNELSFVEPYGIINDKGCIWCKQTGTKDNPYHEAPWNGRIMCLDSTASRNYSGRQYSLELNVDVRDIAWPFNDDVIVEFKFYYQEGTLGLKKSMKVDSLYINTKFYGEKGTTIPKERSCSDKSSAGFTIQGGTKTYRVDVEVWYSFHDGYNSISKCVYFVFDNNYCGHPQK